MIGLRACFLGAFALVSVACAAAPNRPAEAMNVRLDIVHRALMRVAEIPAERGVDGGPGRSRDALAAALVNARRSLARAEDAIHAWERGDPGPWGQVRPCLAEDLERVDQALEGLDRLPAPGLLDVIERGPVESCVDPSYRR